MISDIPIETGSLLTILAISAAVWAVIPANSRLRFRLSVTWLDWLVVIAVIFSVHYLTFERVLREVGLYYSFGSWKFGLDKNSAVYILVAALGLYLLVRARAPKLAMRNIELFEKLADNLLLTKRYDELVDLVEPQLPKLLEMACYQPVLQRLVSKITPKPVFDIQSLMSGVTPRSESIIRHGVRSMLNKLESRLVKCNNSRVHAAELLRNISNTPSLVSYLAVAHPGFCLKLLERPEIVREGFVELFMSSLLADNTSRLYVELKNSQNLNRGNRLALPDVNRILCFLFKDVSVAERLGVYRGIGEAVLGRLNEDEKLIEKYNRSLGSFSESGKYHCPILSGIKLFEIMIHEGIHQGAQDHLWLFYFSHFTAHVLEGMREISLEDEDYEFPTPFYYVLYELVSVASDWVEGGLDVTGDDVAESVKNSVGYSVFYISHQATDVLGTILKKIISSQKIAMRFKVYILEIALRRYKRVSCNSRSQIVAEGFNKSLIEGLGLTTDQDYRKELSRVFQLVDSPLRASVPKFSDALKASIA